VIAPVGRTRKPGWTKKRFRPIVPRMSIDLHTHSTASDGTDSPAEMVRKALAAGLSALGLTDHDTVGGLDELRRAGAEAGLRVVPGVELSASAPPGSGPLHLVGLWLPERPENLLRLLRWVLDAREDRNREVADKLAALGTGVTYDEVRELAGGVVGRPHFAQALLRRRAVTSLEEAFRRYLGRWGKAYAPKAKLTPAQALEALRADGATPVLAHPGLLGLSPAELEPVVRHLRDLGLEAIEVHYPEHSPRQMDQYAALAGRLGLLPSGGSDYHGAVKPGLLLGRGKGSLCVPDSVLDRLCEHRAKQGLWAE
jgi:Predicted metal-dependent phosphoesterases (PHP family)